MKFVLAGGNKPIVNELPKWNKISRTENINKNYKPLGKAKFLRVKN